VKIFVFKRPDDSVWADYSEEHAKRFKVLETIEATSRGDFESIIATHELPRVRALADRAPKEFLARRQQPEPIAAPISPEIRKRSFWERAKWLLTGV
jgi:hypothetical protein